MGSIDHLQAPEKQNESVGAAWDNPVGFVGGTGRDFNTQGFICIFRYFLVLSKHRNGKRQV